MSGAAVAVHVEKFHEHDSACVNRRNLKNNENGIGSLVKLVGGDMEKVNDLILSKAKSDVSMIPEVANHLIDSGGKRLRPMLAIATAQMFDYHGDSHIRLAASVEFMHTATLLHDDVVDESSLRRGKPSARMVWGNEASVLVGDFLLGQAFRMMVETGSLGALKALSRAATVIAEGEVLQLSTSKNLRTTEDEYLAVIRSKTAALFGAACEVGPIISGQEKPVISALGSYGLNLGIAFQLVDDALDFGGSAALLGKNIGDDLREGKITLPILLAYRRGGNRERKFWETSIGKGLFDEEILKQAVEFLNQRDALCDTMVRAACYGENARNALASVPDGKYKDALLEATDFCVRRAC